MDVNSNLNGQLEDSKSSGISTGQILSNLVSVFNPLSSALKSKLDSDEQDDSGNADVVDFFVADLLQLFDFFFWSST